MELTTISLEKIKSDFEELKEKSKNILDLEAIQLEIEQTEKHLEQLSFRISEINNLMKPEMVVYIKAKLDYEKFLQNYENKSFNVL
jgi:hypothetical protein